MLWIRGQQVRRSLFTLNIHFKSKLGRQHTRAPGVTAISPFMSLL